MTTIVVFEEDTRKVLAAIPLAENETALCKNGISFEVFNGTEPIFTDTGDGVILSANKFILNPKEDKGNENQ